MVSGSIMDASWPGAPALPGVAESTSAAADLPRRKNLRMPPSPFFLGASATLALLCVGGEEALPTGSPAFGRDREDDEAERGDRRPPRRPRRSLRRRGRRSRDDAEAGCEADSA